MWPRESALRPSRRPKLRLRGVPRYDQEACFDCDRISTGRNRRRFHRISTLSVCRRSAPLPYARALILQHTSTASFRPYLLPSAPRPPLPSLGRHPRPSVAPYQSKLVRNGPAPPMRFSAPLSLLRAPVDPCHRLADEPGPEAEHKGPWRRSCTALPWRGGLTEPLYQAGPRLAI